MSKLPRLSNISWIFCILVIMQVQLVKSQSNINRKFDNTFIEKTQLDTNRLLSDNPLKSPMGAVFRSAILPGWGQFYNNKYIKAGIAFSANTVLAYHIFWYDNRWENTGNRDFQEKRNLFTWYFALSYLLTMVDAYVDAYLYKFDEAMEISQSIDFQEGKWFAEIQFSYHF